MSSRPVKDIAKEVVTSVAVAARLYPVVKQIIMADNIREAISLHTDLMEVAGLCTGCGSKDGECICDHPVLTYREMNVHPKKLRRRGVAYHLCVITLTMLGEEREAKDISR